MQEGEGDEAGELVELVHGFAVVAAQPIISLVDGIAKVVEPARLHDVVAHGAGDEVVLVGVAALHEELGLRKAQVGADDVFAKGPPAEVIHLFHLAVGTFEQRYLTFHPCGCFAIGDELGDVLVLHRIEIIDVVLEVIPFEQGG